MSNNKHIHSFFDHTDHPDESTLWLYSRGELTRKDMYRVEQHLVDCPMCSDVVDGFSIYESESSLNASKNRASLMFEKAVRKRKNRKILYLAMAAVFVVVAVSTVVLITDFKLKTTQENSSVAQYSPRHENGQTTPGEEGLLIKEDTTMGDMALNEQKDKQKTLTLESEILENGLKEPSPESEEEMKESQPLTDEEDHTDTSASMVLVDEMQALADSEDESTHQDADIIAGMTEDSAGEEKDYGVSQENETKEETVYVADRAEVDMASADEIRDNRTGEDAHVSEKSNVVSRDDQQRPKTVASEASVDDTQFETTVEEEEEEKSSLYQEGVEAKNAGKLNKALRLFSRVPKEETSYWNAQWQIANIYRSRGDTVKAVEVYSIIKDTTNPHQHSARFFYDLLTPAEDQ